MRITARMQQSLYMAMRPHEKAEVGAYLDRVNAIMNSPMAEAERERMTRELVCEGRTEIRA